MRWCSRRGCTHPRGCPPSSWPSAGRRRSWSSRRGCSRASRLNESLSFACQLIAERTLSRLRSAMLNRRMPGKLVDVVAAAVERLRRASCCWGRRCPGCPVAAGCRARSGRSRRGRWPAGSDATLGASRRRREPRWPSAPARGTRSRRSRHGAANRRNPRARSASRPCSSATRPAPCSRASPAHRRN